MAVFRSYKLGGNHETIAQPARNQESTLPAPQRRHSRDPITEPLTSFALALLELAVAARAPTAWAMAANAVQTVRAAPGQIRRAARRPAIGFLGIDDSTWWSHKPGDAESTAAFFVALSRAKQRVICTHCEEGGGKARVSDP